MNEANRDRNPELHEEALFEAAAQLSGIERASFLNGACHGNSSLRQRLEALLAAHEQTDALLATEPYGAGHRSEVSSNVAFSPDGRWIFAGRDGKVDYAWEAARPEQVAQWHAEDTAPVQP